MFRNAETWTLIETPFSLFLIFALLGVMADEDIIAN